MLRWELTRNRLSRFSAACGMSRSEGTIHDDDEGAMAVRLNGADRLRNAVCDDLVPGDNRRHRCGQRTTTLHTLRQPLFDR